MKESKRKASIAAAFFSLAIALLAPKGAGADSYLPLQLDMGTSFNYSMSIQVSLSGEAKTFSLDTGAGMTMLKLDGQVGAFNLYGEIPIDGLAGKKSVCQVVEVPYFQLGDFKKEGALAKICEAKMKSYNNLAVDIFEGQVLSFDIAQSRLGILTAPPANVEYFNLERANSYALKLAMSIDSNPIKAIFDTGTSTTVVDSRFVKAHPEIFSPVATDATSHDITGDAFSVQIYQAVNLKIGEMTIDRMYVVAADLSQFDKSFAAAVILGNDIIFRGNWIFDLKQNRWSVRAL